MSYKVRKTSRGELEALIIGDDKTIMVSKTIRACPYDNSKIIEAHHYINPAEMWSIFAMSGIFTSLLRNENCAESIVLWDKYSSEGSEICNVWYPKPVYLIMPYINKSEEVWLVDGGSNIFSGCNIWLNGNLCLGESNPDPTSWDVMDFMLHNEANHDLQWQGEAITGKQENDLFIINDWPTWKQHSLQIPRAILDVFEA